jgi:hypothetical protein
MTEPRAWLYEHPEGHLNVSVSRDTHGTWEGWLERPLYGPEAADRIEAQAAEIARLEAKIAQLKEADWFYLGDNCSSDQCRFGIDECIAEDFEWDNKQEGDHVLQISGARPVPDMWVALHYFTDDEKDERGDDEGYTYTVHATEEEARAALEVHHGAK